MFLLCHVNSHNHLFKWSHDFVVASPTLLTLAVLGSVIVKIKLFFIDHLISKDHTFKRFCDFKGKRRSY